MPQFVAFLRAINVGGRNVTMAALRSHFEELGLSQVETFIASGNVLFESKARNTTALEKKIEDHLETVLGYEVSTFVRSAAEVAAVAKTRPFTEAQMNAAAAFNVAFLTKPVEAKALERFQTDIDDFRAEGREVYWLCRQKQSESTFSNKVFEKALGVRATFRGLNTVEKLAAKMATKA